MSFVYRQCLNVFYNKCDLDFMVSLYFPRNCCLNFYHMRIYLLESMWILIMVFLLLCCCLMTLNYCKHKEKTSSSRLKLFKIWDKEWIKKKFWKTTVSLNKTILNLKEAASVGKKNCWNNLLISYKCLWKRKIYI